MIVNPKSCIKKTAPIKEIGIATTGTSTDRREPRNKKITMTTISSVSERVLMTSLIALSIYFVES